VIWFLIAVIALMPIKQAFIDVVMDQRQISNADGQSNTKPITLVIDYDRLRLQPLPIKLRTYSLSTITMDARPSYRALRVFLLPLEVDTLGAADSLGSATVPACSLSNETAIPSALKTTFRAP